MAAPASATIYYTYTGVVSYGGIDNAGVFGAAGRNLNGLAYTAVFAFDVPSGGSGTSITQQLSYSDTGSAYGTASAVTGKLTIDGVTYNFDSSYFAHSLQRDGVGFDYDNINQRVDGYSATHEETLMDGLANTTNTMVDTGVFIDHLSYTALPDDLRFGYFSIADRGRTLATGSLYAQTLTISSSAVPEPASWALMIGGLGVVGGALRRRNRSIAFA